MMDDSKYSLSVSIDETNALTVFTTGGASKLIDDIESEVKSIACDVSTAKGRKEIASLAHKVSKSKTALDALGKNLVSDWKVKAKAVDSERKLIRDRLDALRDEVRKPLSEWEAAEEAKAAKIKLEKEIAEALELAIAENDLFDRGKEIERKEEEQRQLAIKAEADELAKAQEKSRFEREERIKAEAVEAARIEIEKKAEQERKDAEQKIINARVAEERAVREKQEANDRRIRELKEQEDRIKKEQHEKEQAKLQAEAEAKAKADKKTANKRHQAGINNSILSELILIGISEDNARSLIIKTAKGEIKHLSINY